MLVGTNSMLTPTCKSALGRTLLPLSCFYASEIIPMICSALQKITILLSSCFFTWVRLKAYVFSADRFHRDVYILLKLPIRRCASQWHLMMINLCSEGGFFKAHLTFPKDYPQKPPKMKFVSDVWHPNSKWAYCFLFLIFVFFHFTPHNVLTEYQFGIGGGLNTRHCTGGRFIAEPLLGSWHFRCSAGRGVPLVNLIVRTCLCLLVQLTSLVMCAYQYCTSLERTNLAMRGQRSAGCQSTL